MLKEKKRKYQKNKKSFLILFLIIINLFLLICIFYSLLKNYSILDKKEYYAKIIVGHSYGFDLNGTALTFGMITPGGSSRREIIINNNYKSDIIVSVFSEGNITKYLKISENDFNLKKNESKEISFSFYAPPGINYGEYNGWITVVIKKA